MADPRCHYSRTASDDPDIHGPADHGRHRQQKGKQAQGCVVSLNICFLSDISCFLCNISIKIQY